MKKYKQNRKLIEISCDFCRQLFEKPISEYNRNKSLNRHNFCSRSCCGKFSNQNRENRVYSHLLNYRYDKSDIYTEFRYCLRNCKKRFQEVDIDLEYLKQLWESQQGICPYSGVKLQLSTYKNIVKNPIYSASLDRIDSSKGYIKGNVQFISISINYMKNTMSHEDTLNLCKIITEHFCSDRTISSS